LEAFLALVVEPGGSVGIGLLMSTLSTGFLSAIEPLLEVSPIGWVISGE